MVGSFAKGLITDETYEYYHTRSHERANRVVSNLREKIKLDVKNFDVFCEILNETLYCEDLHSELQGKFSTLSNIKTNLIFLL